MPEILNLLSPDILITCTDMIFFKVMVFSGNRPKPGFVSVP